MTSGPLHTHTLAPNAPNCSAAVHRARCECVFQVPSSSHTRRYEVVFEMQIETTKFTFRVDSSLAYMTYTHTYPYTRARLRTSTRTHQNNPGLTLNIHSHSESKANIASATSVSIRIPHTDEASTRVFSAER